LFDVCVSGGHYLQKYSRTLSYTYLYQSFISF